MSGNDRRPSRHVVTGCSDCPFQHDAECLIGTEWVDGYLGDGQVNPKCPLLVRPELVVLVLPGDQE